MSALVKRPNECELLVVDDEETICSLIETALQDLCRVSTCANAAEALVAHPRIPRFRRGSHSDLKLPDASGIDVLKAARTKDDYTELMIVTGFASLETAAEAIEIGVSSYLIKPLTMVDLRLQVEKAIANRLFHLKSIMLMQRSNDIAPDIKDHVYDITSLFRFSKKLMLSLEVPEVMRVILDEINDRTNVLYSVVGVDCRDVRELYAMPRVGTMGIADARQSILEAWDNAFPFMDKISFIKNEFPLTVFGGRHDAAFTLELPAGGAAA